MKDKIYSSSRRNFINKSLGLLGSTAIIGLSSSFTQCQTKKENGLKPLRPKVGFVVGLVAPAGGVFDYEDFAKAENQLKGLGYSYKYASNAKKKYGYFAGTDQERADGFNEMMADPSVDIVFALRGGWGCNKILKLIDYEQIKKTPKPIIGFSDITALLNAVYAKTGLITFHGPTATSTFNEYTDRHFRKMMKAEKGYVISSINKTNEPLITLQSGVSQGELIGGNLVVLSSMIGSGYLPDWKGKILFLEEIGEEVYRVDRMMSQLENLGVFDQIAGLVIGSFRKCEPEWPEKALSVIQMFHTYTDKMKFPVFKGAAIGHIREKLTIPVGCKVEMDADKGTLTLLESPFE